MTTRTVDPLKGLNSRELISHAKENPTDERISQSVAFRTANWSVGTRQKQNLQQALRIHTEALAEAAAQAREVNTRPHPDAVPVKPKKPKKRGRPRDVRVVDGRKVDYTDLRQEAWEMRQEGLGTYKECLASICEHHEVPMP